MAAKKKKNKKSTKKPRSKSSNVPAKETTQDNASEETVQDSKSKDSTPDTSEDKAETNADEEPGNEAYQQRDLPGYVGVTFRGVCMGGADVIPGVSGGTMALILGIYRELIASIRSFDLDAARLIMKGDLKGFSKHVNLPFLIFLGVGIMGAIVTLAKIIPQLLAKHPAPVHGLFFGLILASIVIVWNQVEQHDATTVALLVVGAIASYFLVGMIPVQTPSNHAFIFLTGSIAIIAMILPGISGSFILLLMGKYAFILESLRHVVHTRQLDDKFVIVVIFAAGCGVGLLMFSRVLNWLLARYQAVTLALLSGLMIGSLRRIWPFQEYVKAKIGKKIVVKSYTNFWPSTWSGEYILAVVLVFVGVLLVYSMHVFANRSKAGQKA